MDIAIKQAWIFLTLMFAAVTASGPAMAHSFNVALVLPSVETVANQNQHMRQGFMLATTERDAHPNQESDGHLGGLDVYVTVLGGATTGPDGSGPEADWRAFEIVAVFATGRFSTHINKDRAGRKAVFLYPGVTPFNQPQTPAVAAFLASYQKRYGTPPTADAAQGYNAARRIDAAVRSQGAAGNKFRLEKSFENSAENFIW